MNLTRKHKAYFDAACAVSQLSDFPRVKIGAIAVYKHRIISSSCNQTKSHPLQKKFNKHRFEADSNHTAHAELMCLNQLIGRRDIDFKDVSLYVGRTLANGSLGDCRPCPGCMALIRELGIRHIYYTNNGSYVYEELIY